MIFFLNFRKYLESDIRAGSVVLNNAIVTPPQNIIVTWIFAERLSFNSKRNAV